MNLEVCEQRALSYGLVPAKGHPQWRHHLCVQRVACGCYMKAHYAPKALNNIAAKCPRCGDSTPPTPLTSSAGYTNTTYEKYVKQVLHDFPHLSHERQNNTDSMSTIDKVIARLEATQPPPQQPARTILDVFMDEIAANFHYLLAKQNASKKEASKH